MDMSVFLYRLCEVLLPNTVASWLSSGRLLIISVTGKVLCKDIYIQPWNWNGLFYTWKSSKHELSDDDGSTVVVDHSKNCLFQFVFNELNAHFLLLLVAIFQLVLSFWDCIYLLVTSGLVSVRLLLIVVAGTERDINGRQWEVWKPKAVRGN